MGLDRMETHSRRKVLLFHGVKEEQGEDVFKKTLGVLTGHLKLSDATPELIDSCHRLGVKRDASRPILVRFASVRFRSRVWNAKTALRGSKITLSEFLTKARQSIFIEARKHFGMKKCWSAEGDIIILLPDNSRKKISALSELKQLVAQYPKGNK
ncbi:uncharacterized protein LOC124542548 [Vanessa cardui]|uniref:uncharacterized protein LOC124542548 n=1 Tax=Vanessa cardui TaxID=171605 RepID=UPI001F1410BE|nr:uncharacterized protein LOC124542548 [Vanessa cardui]